MGNKFLVRACSSLFGATLFATLFGELVRRPCSDNLVRPCSDLVRTLFADLAFGLDLTTSDYKPGLSSPILFEPCSRPCSQAVNKVKTTLFGPCSWPCSQASWTRREQTQPLRFYLVRACSAWCFAAEVACSDLVRNFFRWILFPCNTVHLYVYIYILICI